MYNRYVILNVHDTITEELVDGAESEVFNFCVSYKVWFFGPKFNSFYTWLEVLMLVNIWSWSQ